MKDKNNPCYKVDFINKQTFNISAEIFYDLEGLPKFKEPHTNLTIQ